MRMRIFICSIGFIFFGVALADEKSTSENLTPVYEPETSNISERLEKIEKQLDNSTLLEMLDSLESLKAEINTLRGEIEVQTHTIDQLKQKQRDLYTDLDKRLERFRTTETNENLPGNLQVLDTNTANEESTNENNITSEETLVIETTIPLGTEQSLENYLASNNRVAILLVERIDEYGEINVSIRTTEFASALDSELSNINFMLGFSLPADDTTFRVISDSRNEVMVGATAVFVSKKPYLYFSKTLKRRDEAEIVFKGGEGSVYSEIEPVIYFADQF